MLRLTVVGAITAVVLAAAVPALADVADDLRNCDGGNEPREERIAACTRLIDAGDRAATELIWIHTRRGDFCFADRNFEPSLAEFDMVVDLDPENWSPHFSRGRVLTELDRYEEAISAYDRSIELNPRNSSSYYRRGVVYWILDDTAAAIPDFDQAIQLDPNAYWVYRTRGRVLLGEGRLGEAREDFSASLAIQPYDHYTYAGRGLMAEEEGDIAAAIADYRVAQLLNPNFRDPDERLPVLVPEQAAPDLGPLAFTPPEAGLSIRYIQVVNEVVAISEADAFIGDLLFWFVGEPDKPLPLERDILDRDFGPTIDNVTPVTVTLPFRGTLEPVVVEYEYGLLPLILPAQDGPPTGFTYEGVAAIWGLAPGETTSGTRTLLLGCPPERDPVAEMLGCLPGVASIEVGTLEWTATFVGWEYVLVPAGQRVAARIIYDETAITEFFGRAITRTSQATFRSTRRLIGGSSGSESRTIAFRLLKLG